MFIIHYTQKPNQNALDLNVRPETINILIENTEEKFFDIGLGNDFFFLDVTPKAQVEKAKINKRDYIKLQSFCTVKETINKMKKQPQEWERNTCKPCI